MIASTGGQDFPRARFDLRQLLKRLRHIPFASMAGRVRRAEASFRVAQLKAPISLGKVTVRLITSLHTSSACHPNKADLAVERFCRLMRGFHPTLVR